MLACIDDLVSAIAPCAGIEKIFLLGQQTTIKKITTVFSTPLYGDEQDAHYFLLALVADGVTNKSMEEFIEAKVGRTVSVTAWGIKARTFKESLLENNFFANKIISSARILYDTCGKIITEKVPVFSETASTIDMEPWANRSIEFLAGAELYLARKQLKMAAFCLHQAAEQAYTAIIYGITGLQPKTHNLTRLHRYASFLEAGICSLFPDGVSKNECLLHDLQKAYIETRYADSFHLSEQKINIVFDKIRTLQQIVIHLTGFKQAITH